MRKLFLALALIAGWMIPTAGFAQVEADPNNQYPVGPDAGPWMICATSYVGPQAPMLAHELVLEIRSRFKMPAYVLNRGDEERRKQQEEKARLEQIYPNAVIPKRMISRVQDQCAVLVGGYKDQEAAARALKDFKKLPPPSQDRLMPILSQVAPAEGSRGEIQIARANPFVNAFVVHNPTVPRDVKPDPENDRLLRKLNSDERHSLLKCRKRYTLLVATFHGLQTFQPAAADNEGFFEKLWRSSDGGMLNASGQNARNLAAALRKAGFEAYVLHVREGSVVTIDGFDREDDPRIKTVEQTLASRFQFGQGVQFLPQPLVIRVPQSQ